MEKLKLQNNQVLKYVEKYDKIANKTTPNNANFEAHSPKILKNYNFKVFVINMATRKKSRTLKR